MREPGRCLVLPPSWSGSRRTRRRRVSQPARFPSPSAVGSVRRGAIYAGAQRLVKDLPYGVFGMAAGNKRGILWAGASTVPQFERFREEERDRAAVLKIDLASGKLLATIPAPAGKHLFGDVALAPNGDSVDW